MEVLTFREIKSNKFIRKIPKSSSFVIGGKQNIEHECKLMSYINTLKTDTADLRVRVKLRLVRDMLS